MKPERPLLRRRSRRALIVAAVASLLILTVWSAMPNSPLLNSIGLAAFIVYGSVLVRLGAWVGLPFRQEPDLDERQRLTRDRAQSVAYLAMSAALLFALVSAFLLDGVQWPSADGRTAPLVIFGLIALIHPFVPSVILAWTEPDPIPREDGMHGTS